MPETRQTCGNPEVIELLEAYLEIARTQPWGHIAIVMVGHPRNLCADFAGDIALEESCKEGLDRLTKKVEASIDNWTLPPRNEYLDKSYVCYNMANGPIGFDFLVWLVDAEMTRVRAGAPGPLMVAFFMGRNAETRTLQRDRQAWVDNVFRPALKMLGAVEDAAALHGHHKAVFVTRDIVAASKVGEAVPRFKALPNDFDPIWLHYPKSFVTVTLREAEHWPHRNSNIEAWTEFADYLDRRGENVVFVRDTGKANEPLTGFTTCPEASLDLYRRMEIYSRAKANLFVSNGPVALAVFGDRPWLQFVTLEPDGSGYAPDTALFWKKHHGIAPGEQYPWCRDDQRMVWAPDSYENIVAAWEAHIAGVTSEAA